MKRATPLQTIPFTIVSEKVGRIEESRMSSIDEILRLRSDHSPYLVHLTRDAVAEGKRIAASDILRQILKQPIAHLSNDNARQYAAPPHGGGKVRL